MPPKRTASSPSPTSPADNHRLLVRNRIVDSLHKKEDEVVERRLEKHCQLRRRELNPSRSELLDLCQVMFYVATVAVENSHSDVEPKFPEYFFDILEDNAEIRNIVEQAIIDKSYKNIRNLRA
jgi:hypothetical protein